MGAHDRDRRVEWPAPRDDPLVEPSHRAARIADRERGVERGDVDLGFFERLRRWARWRR